MKRIVLFATLFVGGVLVSCQHESGTPKPRGYYRIDFPKKAYKHYDEVCPYSFDIPVYSKVAPDLSKNAEPCWINVDFPQFNGRIYLTYHQIKGKESLNHLVEDTRKLAFKHTIKATAIDESLIAKPAEHVYGTYYDIDGNTASSLQFYLTDSTRNFIRGALYFKSQPRIDSIKPVLEFIRKDVDRLIGTFKWKK
ncbi:gliding motility lipoprotein GldD [Solitalea koreensis]|uniref:gliding motility lipoprotein GldD n=1 Tax=Solitalea koreensis TaxID=543615 RepID=UPI0011588B04|nr:gliding motility lipoprotein GldD [Solitalea koreensis]